ncbi:MAG TPA: glycosyltransferase [Candidatus Bathyarchaeia archaeon]|nr:glycosyltransferase [Candidatus Bathyarchaeia archaeon]
MGGEPVSIIIPAFNQLEFCRQCVEMLLRTTTPPYKLILVDNGSTDGVGEYFDSVAGAGVIRAGENRGFAGGVNLGLERAEGHAVLLNSDTLTPTGWLDRLTAALESSSDIGLIGPMTNYAAGAQCIPNLVFDSMEGVEAYSRHLAETERGHVRDVPKLVGFCMMIRKDAREKIGVFDEAFGIGNYEDDDYCMRAICAGYRVCIALDTFVFHYGSRTFAGMGITDEKWRDLRDSNERRFLDKWRDARPDSEAAMKSRRLAGRARSAARRGDLVGAANLYAQAISAYPLDAQNHNDVGAVLWHLNMRDTAISYFKAALKLKPDYAEARENLRDAATAMGKLDEVADLLEDVEPRREH